MKLITAFGPGQYLAKIGTEVNHSWVFATEDNTKKGTFPAEAMEGLEGENEKLLAAKLEEIETERRILFKLLKDRWPASNEARLIKANEYQRRLQSIANKIGESSQDVDKVIRAISEELFKEMWEKPKPKKV